MRLVHLARRLLCASALIMIAAIAISVMTHDAWLMAGHVAGVVSAVVAAVAVLAFALAGLRRVAKDLPQGPPADTALAPYEMGLTGLEAAGDPAPRSASDESSDHGPAPSSARARTPGR
jgi:4-amino-4-deoxy-L-arabinose transferase-like glycosyltransferase